MFAKHTPKNIVKKNPFQHIQNTFTLFDIIVKRQHSQYHGIELLRS